MGFKRCKSDAGVYVLKNNEGLVIFIIYVDDAAMMGNKASLVQKQKAIFMKRWESRDLGPVKEYLGLQVKRDRTQRVLYFHQIPYAVKVLKCFGLEQSKPVRTPLPSGYISHPAPVGYYATPELRTKYQSIIGSLLFIMLGTRPDI